MKCAKLEKFLFLTVVLLLGLVLTTAAKSADSDLLGWWPLDEGAGNVVNDLSGKGNHGTIQNPNGGLGPGGSVWDTDPERGVVLSFNGNDTTGAYVNVGMIIPPMTLTNDFTWAFWAKQTSGGTGVNEVILGNRYGASDPLQFSKFTPTKFEYYNNGNNSGFIDYDDIPDGMWLHHAVVKDGARLTYYRNGVVAGKSTITATLVAQPFYIGGDASAERWSGWLSDVRIYNYAASEAEIAAIMSGYGSNMRPFVDAGDDRTVILPNDIIVLNGTVTDDGVGDPNGFLAMEWSQLSGPGAVSFEPNEFVEDPIVKLPPLLGIYILQLYATDGKKDATDTVMIAVDEPFCPVGDLNGDCRVDWQDLHFFAGRWLDDSGCSANINGDAVVNAMDFSCLAENWLKAKAFLVINEFMASNSTYLEDPQGQYDDWLEIYNAADVATGVGGMYLTDDLDEPTKWQIPSDNPSATTIPAHGYLLIWADSDTGHGGLHANFQLDATGEKIGLFGIEGRTLIDSVSFSEQRPDVSYGRYPDGSNNWRFFGIPTAGYKNDGAYLGLVTDTKFSHDRGFYDTPFEVVITCATLDAIIHYTTDGSAPTETHGYEYAGPIRVGATTCLRAMAFKPGWMPTNVDTHTYIFLKDVIYQPSNPPGFPSSWGSTAGDYQMDPDIVNSAQYGPLMNDALLSIPTVSIVMNVDDLFGPSGIYTNSTARGTAWERPASVELIYPDGSDGFHVNCGIRIQGGYSRSASRKQSFRLLFKGMYGLSKLKYPWFGDDVVDTFDTITLRAGFNDGYGWNGAKATEQYIRDEFGRSLQVATGHAGSHGTFVHLYVNGLYWGLYNPCERPDGSFSASYYGGDKDDWDVFSQQNFEIHQGDRTALNLLLTKCRAGLSSNEAYQQIQGNNADGTPNPAYPNLIDVPNYIDYLIVNLWPGNDDWPWNNYWLARKRTDDSTGFKFYCWDMELIIGRDHSSGSNLYMDRNTDFSQVAEMHQYLKQNAEYRMLFADHVHRFFFNGGILTPESLICRYRQLADKIEMAMITESARWGDMHYYPPLTQQEWYAKRDWILNTYLPQRTGIVLKQFRNYGLYPNVDAPVFYINGSYQHGGYISPSDLFSISTATSGTIYYTLDGFDPRVPGGAVNTAHAAKYAAPIKLTESTHVKARTLSGSTWSALNEATFAVGPVAEDLRITEIMYHPADTDSPSDANEEFLELKNIGGETINLNLARFTNGIDFTFPSVELTAGKYVLIVKDQAVFSAQYPDFAGLIAGEYSGSLANDGERIRLEDAVGQTILDFKYSDAWREITDGQGFSLTIVNPANPDINSWGEKDAWRASAFYGGSPGWDDTGIIPVPGTIVINEVLAHAHADATDWIELHNTTGAAINIGGWFLSDSDTELTKYQIADGTVIAAGGYIVLYQDEDFGNPADPGCHTAFALSENGDQVYLSSALAPAPAAGVVLTGYQEVEDFGASETGVSFGRYYKGSTDNYNFVAMSENTPGAANAYPKVGPIVINEIMYNPGSGNQDEEYIELLNISSEPVDLYRYDKSEAWRFTDGIEFVFASDPVVTIPAGEYLLVVKHLDAFAARYGAMPGGVVVVGPYDGQLQNGGEKLDLSMPGDVDEFGTRCYIRIERVSYSDGSHPEDCPGGVDLWPVEADGGGMSLSRRVSSAYGNDVANWKAATASPGFANP
jgi:hypothetical protein